MSKFNNDTWKSFKLWYCEGSILWELEIFSCVENQQQRAKEKLFRDNSLYTEYFDTDSSCFSFARFQNFVSKTLVKVTICEHRLKQLSAGSSYQYLHITSCAFELTWNTYTIKFLINSLSRVLQFSETSNITLSVLTFTPTMEDDGKYLTCRAENPIVPESAIEDRWRLNVHCKCLFCSFAFYFTQIVFLNH